MASKEAIAKLETKAVSAEKLISLLRAQIAEVKSAQLGLEASKHDKEVESLRQENTKLMEEVELWKQKLTAAELANGKKVFSAPSQDAQPVKVEKSEVESAEKSVETSAKPKKEKVKPEKVKEKKEAKPQAEEPPVNIGLLDLRVGHIRSAKKHPDADALYVEEVDVGEEKPRTVISGLVKFIPEAEMQDRMAVLLCNLKPSKMRGIMSEAMVMCASTPDKVEILAPPAGSKPGDLVRVEGFPRSSDAALPQLNPKKKVFEAVAPDLQVNPDKEATYKGVRWTVNGQPITSQTLVNVNVK